MIVQINEFSSDLNCAGIYMFWNTISEKQYIGQAKNLYNRLHDHLSSLRRSKNSCRQLQNAYNKYGEHSFIFIVLEIVNNEDQLNSHEQTWLDYLQLEVGKDHCLNICWKPNTTTGYKYTIEQSFNLSKAKKGIRQIPENNKLRVENMIKAVSYRKKIFSIVSPDGITYKDVCGIRAFAKEHNLDQANLGRVLDGKIKHVKGWTVLGKE